MPITIPAPGPALWQQVLAKLATDTDVSLGLMNALGAGANSLFPNYTAVGPSADRSVCPVPFLIVAAGGTRAVDQLGREVRVHIEVHDDPDQGEQRRPGIIWRIKNLICEQEWRPTSDPKSYRYLTGLSFESESPVLEDERYHTEMVQLTLVCSRALDRTSGRGYNG